MMEAKRSVREFTMTLEALASNELPAFLVYDTISATPLHSSTTSFLLENAGDGVSMMGDLESQDSRSIATAPMRRKRRRRTRTCKNKEAAETQRMTHIAVERNRRRQMNEHLTSLRSLMPESYIQRGDQASIVGGAIDFVKELEQLLQSLEAQKWASQQKQREKGGGKQSVEVDDSAGGSSSSNTSIDDTDQPPFAQFFAYPQYNWCHARREYPPLPESQPALADIEVTLIETHANLRILSPRRPRQLLKMVAGLQTLRLTILHLNVTTLDSMVLYSLNAKVEEGCNLTTVDGIADAVHHILALIEAETVSDLSQ